jgi:hypothetical protein
MNYLRHNVDCMTASGRYRAVGDGQCRLLLHVEQLPLVSIAGLQLSAAWHIAELHPAGIRTIEKSMT